MNTTIASQKLEEEGLRLSLAALLDLLFAPVFAEKFAEDRYEALGVLDLWQMSAVGD